MSESIQPTVFDPELGNITLIFDSMTPDEKERIEKEAEARARLLNGELEV